MRKALYLIAVLFASESYALNVSISLDINPDNSFNTEYPTGNKPPAAASLAWDDACVTTALAGITNLITGTGTGAGGIELAACRSGTNGASGVVSDDSASWSVVVGTDTEVTSVVNTCSSDGSGTVAFTLTYMGESDISGPHSWACNTAPTSDTLAPSIPTGFEVTGAGTNEIYIKHDPVCDNFTGSEAGSGTATYYYRRDASALSNQAAANCTTPQLTYENVGSADGTPSGSQTGNDFTLGFGGSGNDSTADNFRWAYVDLTGDATAIVQVTNLTSTVNFAKIGVAIRTDSAVGAKGCFLHYQYNGNVQMRCRATDDVATTTVFSQAASLNLWVKLQYDTTNQEIDGYYSTDGGEWTLGGTFAVSLPTTKRVGAFITSNSLTTNVTGQVDELNFHNKADVTATLSTTVSGSFDVAAEDSDANRSAYSDAATGTPNPGAAPGKKWNPGWYVKTQGNHCQQDEAAYYSAVVSQINTHVPDSTEFAGAMVRIPWGAIETGNQVYDFSRIYQVLGATGLAGKQLLIEIEHKCFSGSTNAAALMPSDLESDVSTTNTGIISNYWQASIMDRIILFYQALATEFDGNTRIESITAIGSESCPSFGANAPADYSHAASLAQMERLYAAASAAFEETNVFAPWNCGQGGTLIDGVESAYQVGLGRSGPDTHADGGFSIFIGSTCCSGQSAVRDYTGLIPHQGTLSAPNLGGKDDVLPLSSWQTNFIDAGKYTHVALVLTDGSAGGTKTDIITHIEAGGGATNNTYETCPTLYTSSYGGCQ